MSLRTPLSRVSALGAAREGTGHFWWQRMTAIAMIPLTIYLIRTGIVLAGADAQAISAYFADPVNALLMVLSAITVCWHLQQGLKVVIEDYVSDAATKTVITILNFLFAVGMGGLLVAFTVKLGFGG